MTARVFGAACFSCLLVVGLALVDVAAQQPLATIGSSGFVFGAPAVSGLTAVRGIVPYGSGTLSGFPAGHVAVEQSLGRISITPQGGNSPISFATGLTNPTDVAASPSSAGPFGNFLYVTDTGANRIAKISNTGVVSTFATLAAAPRRLAFSSGRGPVGQSVFGNFLFVTLANGQVVKIDNNGAVSTCVSGLTSPEGLVFGPGGAWYTTTLFVAESTANRVSQIDFQCTAATPFITSGITNPLTLEVSPGGPWGDDEPSQFTVFVLNSSSLVSVSSVTKNVTTFASGFVNADTVRFGPTNSVNFLTALPLDLYGTSARLRVSDAGTGTIEDIQVNTGGLFVLTFNGCGNPPLFTCHVGEVFSMDVQVNNPWGVTLHGELKSGFEAADGGKIPFHPLSPNNHFVVDLPPGFSTTIHPWVSVTMPPIPYGRLCYRAGFQDPELNTSTAAFRYCFNLLP